MTTTTPLVCCCRVVAAAWMEPTSAREAESMPGFPNVPTNADDVESEHGREHNIANTYTLAGVIPINGRLSNAKYHRPTYSIR